MSNRVMFTAMQFKETNSLDAEVSFGYVASDDYATTFHTGEESPMPVDAEEFFHVLLYHRAEFGDEALDGLIDTALEYGAYIDDTWYDAEELNAFEKMYSE